MTNEYQKIKIYYKSELIKYLYVELYYLLNF